MIGDHHEIIIFEKHCGAGNVWLASFWSSPRLRRPAKIAVRHVLRPNRSEDWKLLPKTRKNSQSAPFAWSLWQHLTCGLILSTMLLLFFFIQSVLKLSSSQSDRVWFSMSFAAIGASLLISLIAPFFMRSKFQVSKSKKVLTYLTSSASLITILNLLYWSLYQWWTLY